MFSVHLHALDVEENVQGWKRFVVVIDLTELATTSHFFRCFLYLETALMGGHVHDFFTASTDQVTTTMVSNLGTSAEQPTAMTALATVGRVLWVDR